MYTYIIVVQDFMSLSAVTITKLDRIIRMCYVTVLFVYIIIIIIINNNVMYVGECVRH